MSAATLIAPLLLAGCSGTAGPAAAPELPRLAAPSRPVTYVVDPSRVPKGSPALEAFLPPARLLGPTYRRASGSVGIGPATTFSLCGGAFGPSERLRTDALETAYLPQDAGHGPEVDLVLVEYRLRGAELALDEARIAVGACDVRRADVQLDKAGSSRLTVVPTAGLGTSGLVIRETDTSPAGTGRDTYYAFVTEGKYLAVVATALAASDVEQHVTTTTLTYLRRHLR